MESIVSSSRPFTCCLPPVARPAARGLHPAAAPPSSRRLLSLRASLSSSSAEKANSGRRTLSAGWTVPTSLVTSPRMPSIGELDPSSMLFRQRIVFLSSTIDTDTADFLISQLLLLDAEDKEKDIKLFIDCPGGSVSAAMGIYDVMKMCTADVSTVCFGIAAYMGAFLLAAGTKGKRFCMPNARVMIHEPTGLVRLGSSIETGLQARELNYERIKVTKMLSRITGKSEDEIKADTRDELYMSPWEAKEYGLVDAVIDDGKPGLVAPTAKPAPPPKSGRWLFWTMHKDSMDARREDYWMFPSEMKLLPNKPKSDDEGRDLLQQNESRGNDKGREQAQEQSPA